MGEVQVHARNHRPRPTNPPRQASWLAKDHVALVQTGHELNRVKVQSVKLTTLKSELQPPALKHNLEQHDATVELEE